MSVTYRRILTITSALIFHNGTMDIGDHRVSVRSITLKLGNDDVCVHDAVVNFGDGYMCVYCEFGLGMSG